MPSLPALPSLPAAFLSVPIAHRALHDRAKGRIENSPAAIRAAIAAGYGIEIDLQLSSDGVPMVFHDDRLDRLTARAGAVEALSAAELGDIVLTGGTDTIATLRDVLDLIAGRVPVLIELKDRSGVLSKTDEKLERATASALAAYDGPAAVMSFNPHSIAAMARLAPEVPRGLVTAAFDPEDWDPVAPATCVRLREIPDYARIGASFISHDVADLARPRVAELKADGAAILCWTVKSHDAEARARQVAHNITFEGYIPAKT